MRLYPAALVILCLAASSCSKADGPQAAAEARTPVPGGGPAVPVVVASVVEKAMPVEIRAIGRADTTNVAVRSQVTGELQTINFKEGDDVTKGQVLFQIDRRPLEAALRQAEANLARNVAEQAHAEAQARRYDDLAKRGIATREQLETSRTSAEALQASVAANRAAVENVKLQLQYTTIVAPTSGRTGELIVYPGNIIRALDERPLVVINKVTPIDLVFGVPESQLPTLRQFLARGTLAVEAVDTNTNEESPSIGRVTFVDNAVDATTGLIKVKATFDNRDRRLWPGQFVNVVVRLTTDPHALVVPSVAVQTGPDGLYAFVVKSDQTAEVRPVTVLRTSGQESIIGSGLKAGESVVTEGHLRLVAGSKVSIK
jgi:multidrug efflux system membrane fusion protein